jgi:hypothetical protein
MSGSSCSEFTWKDVANVLRVSLVSNAVSFQREIKRQKKGKIGVKGASVGAKAAPHTSNQTQFHRPGTSRQA